MSLPAELQPVVATMDHESEFRTWFLREWRKSGYWADTVEAAAGGTEGYPDCLLQPPDRAGPLPTELKYGEVKNGMVFARRIRPVQVGWHCRYAGVAGVSLTLVGVRLSGWAGLLVAGAAVRRWREGYPAANLVVGERLVASVLAFCNGDHSEAIR